jgi:hypothetical protein
MSFTITLDSLRECGACSTAHFESKAGGALALDYPHGWQPADTERVAVENPVALLWLVSRRLVPVSFSQANAALRKVHGVDTVKKIRAAFVAGAKANAASAAAAVR